MSCDEHRMAVEDLNRAQELTSQLQAVLLQLLPPGSRCSELARDHLREMIRCSTSALSVLQACGSPSSRFDIVAGATDGQRRSPGHEKVRKDREGGRSWSPGDVKRRDKMESIALRLDTVADCIAKILSEYVKNPTSTKNLSKVQSTLHLRKQVSPYITSKTLDSIETKSQSSDVLSLHVCGDHHEFCIHHPEGSIIIMLRAGDILVTIGKTLQELFNGELKNASAEALFQPVDDSFTSFSLEYMCCPLVLSHGPDHETKTISLTDQLLVVLFLVLLYNLIFCFIT